MKGRTLVLLLGGAVLVTLATLVAVPFWALNASVPDPTPTSPALVQSLPAGFAQADTAFAARIADAFPPFSPEAALVQRLQAEGFTLSASQAPGAGAAEMRWANFTLTRASCTLTWRVRWNATDGRLVSATGNHVSTCL